MTLWILRKGLGKSFEHCTKMMLFYGISKSRRNLREDFFGLHEAMKRENLSPSPPGVSTTNRPAKTGRQVRRGPLPSIASRSA